MKSQPSCRINAKCGASYCDTSNLPLNLLESSVFSQPPNTCDINDVCVNAGTLNSGDPCLFCSPQNNTIGWTRSWTQCSIGGACIAAGTLNPANPCEVCDPTLALSTWSPTPGKCLINNVCRSSGDVLPLTAGGTNPCSVCRPSVSRTAWSLPNPGTMCCTPVAVPVAPDFAPYAYTAIGGVIAGSGGCSTCDGANGFSALFALAAGTTCDDGSTCTLADRCDGFGKCVAALNSPGNPLLTPDVSGSGVPGLEFSSLADLTTS